MRIRVKKGLYLCGIIIALLITGVVYQYRTVRQYEDRISADYRRAFSDIADYVEDIDYDITKALLVSSPSAFTGMAEEVWMLTCLAREEIGRLPVAQTELDNAEKYFAQTGEFMLSLSRKTAKGEQISQEERNQLVKLGEYASKLNADFQNAETDIYTATFTREELMAHGGSFLAASSSAINDNMSATEESMAEYPSLIYDGPFSEHLQSAKPKLIQGESEISQKEAQQQVISYFGDEKPENIKLQGEFGDGIKAYSYTVNRGDDSVTVEITKKGGQLLSVLNNRIPKKRTYSTEDAIKCGARFIKSVTGAEVKESYYRYEGNNLIINYAPLQDGWVMYPDLIKAIVALDTCEIVGYEAKGYIMNHYDRALPQTILSEEEARSLVRSEVEVASIGKALIPLDGGREAFCYEIKGKFMNKQVIVYINAVTGEEEDTLILIDTPEGTLAM